MLATQALKDEALVVRRFGVLSNYKSTREGIMDGVHVFPYHDHLTSFLLSGVDGTINEGIDIGSLESTVALVGLDEVCSWRADDMIKPVTSTVREYLEYVVANGLWDDFFNEIILNVNSLDVVQVDGPCRDSSFDEDEEDDGFYALM